MSQVQTEDGRTLEVRVAGPENGLTLLFHWGTPSAAVPFGILERPAAERGLRVVTYSRPGYGQSTPRPDGTVRGTIADDATDVAAVLDGLGVDEFVTLGWSGGGPRALACAALLPPRCLAAACLAGAAPYHAKGLDFMAGMGPENLEEFGAALEGPEALQGWMDAHAGPSLSATPKDIAEALGGLVSDVDKAALTGELADQLATALHHAGHQGTVGWHHDDLALTRPWGFDLTAITVPVSIWQGAQDRMVPYAHGTWLARRLPHARVHLYEDEGHISLVMQMGRILDDLLEAARSSS